MLVANGVAAFQLTSSIMGHDSTIFPSFIWDEESAILIDTGYPSHSSIIIQEIIKNINSLNRLKAIIITHQDIDHIGGGKGLIENVPHKIEIIAHEADAPYIEGKLQLLKLAPDNIKQIIRSLPPGIPDENKKSFQKALENPPKIPITQTISKETYLPFCGGISLIPVPGHTPGHICVYHHQSQTLVAGDSLFAQNGMLQIPDKSLCADFDQAKKSLTTLLNYDIRQVVCYHGGIATDNVRQQLKNLC